MNYMDNGRIIYGNEALTVVMTETNTHGRLSQWGLLEGEVEARLIHNCTGNDRSHDEVRDGHDQPTYQSRELCNRQAIAKAH